MNLKQLKFFCELPPVYGLNVSADLYQTSGVRFIRTTDIGTNGQLADKMSGVFLNPEIVSSQYLLREGDLLLSRSGTLGRCLLVGHTPQLLTHAGYLVRFRPNRCTYPPYLAYCAQSQLMSHAISAEAVVSTIGNFNAEKYANVRLPWWPVETQRAIARHLDRETVRIDALIAAKRATVELLDERWQAVMHNAVSGIHTNSGGKRRTAALPWLDSVPSHWREVQLKLIARLGTGHTPSRSHPEWWVDPTIPWITTGEVAQMRADRIEYITETRERISKLGLANSSAEIHSAETVVLCRTASAGYSAIMGREMATSQDFATWTCGPLLLPRFLLLCLRAMRQDLLGRLAMGSTHKTIYMPDIESISLPLPPVEEQEEIVAAVYDEQGALDACADRLGAQIDLLKEHRQALITAAITGELEISEAA